MAAPKLFLFKKCNIRIHKGISMEVTPFFFFFCTFLDFFGCQVAISNPLHQLDPFVVPNTRNELNVVLLLHYPQDGAVMVWSVAKRSALLSIKAHTEAVTSVAFGISGLNFASAGRSALLPPNH